MYWDFFGLQRAPFSITPDIELFFSEGRRGEVLEAILYAIVSGEALTKVVGEVGTGKTMLCRMLEQRLPDHIRLVYLANPNLTPDNVLHAIAFELGFKVSGHDSRFVVLKLLQSYLLRAHSNHQQVVIFVEEAQGMPLATLEEIRLLSNLETYHYKLLQVVLFGQPELDVALNARHVRQIRERITNSFYLTTLSFSEARRYIHHRLTRAGWKDVELFSLPALMLLHFYTQGLMRRINIVADKALLSAYIQQRYQIGALDVWKALRDCEFIRLYRMSRFVLFGVALSGVAVLAYWMGG